MRVPEDWDRPLPVRGSISFYPPLRFPGLDKEPVHEASTALGGLNGGTTFGSGTNGGGSFGGGTNGATTFGSGTNGATTFGGGTNGGSSFGGTNGGGSFGGGTNGGGSFGGAAPTTSFGSTDRGRNPEPRSFGFEEERERERAPRSASVPAAPRPREAGDAPPATPASPEDVEVRGDGDLPGPWKTWEQVTFPSRVRNPLVAAGFPAPTAIQQHSWPILSLGRDMIGVAKTGSGKTLAFLLPVFAQLIETGADLRGPPACLVLAPTRELACQIEQESKMFGTVAGILAACLYGGAPKGPQLATLRQRPQVIVATPGRLNDLLEPPMGLTVAVDVKSMRYLVLDEADRMLDMGFEPQIRKIIAQLPKQRQTVMFTATWPASVRRLASEFLNNPAEVRAGEVESLSVNPDITQLVVFCDGMREKEEHVQRVLREGGEDQAIVFVNTKRMCETVSLRIDSSVCIHGDKDQQERDRALMMFKTGARRVLVATDVAARGLDIKTVRIVINFDPPSREEDYVHRVGRTGRAGLKGTAVSFLTNDDGTAATSIANMMKKGGLPVPEELERRLASGEMRMGGGGGRGRGESLGPRSRTSFRSRDDDDFGGFGGRSGGFGGGFGGFGGGFGSGDRDRFGGGSSMMTDCPTY